MSPSISSVATSASEVSEPKLCYLIEIKLKTRTDFLMYFYCTSSTHVTHTMVCHLAYQIKQQKNKLEHHACKQLT